jgi:hypothetical protein
MVVAGQVKMERGDQRAPLHFLSNLVKISNSGSALKGMDGHCNICTAFLGHMAPMRSKARAKARGERDMTW